MFISTLSYYDVDKNGTIDLGEVVANDCPSYRVLNIDGEAGISPDEFIPKATMVWSFDGAIARNSPEVFRICDLVKENGINTVLGIIEKEGGTLYCSSLCIGRDGTILSWHRKLMPTAMERVIWGQGCGSTMRVAQTNVGKVSMAICWENYMPLYRSHLYSQGAQLHCLPTVDDRDVWIPTLQMIALEGRCFVISACQFMTGVDVKMKGFDPVQGTDPSTVLIGGGSCIISPMGEILAAPLYNQETIITAEIYLDEITHAKFDLDIAGHYSRPDVFNFSVNIKSQMD